MFKCNYCGECCQYDNISFDSVTAEQLVTARQERTNYPTNAGCEMLVYEGGLAVCLIEKLFGREAKPEVCKYYRCGRDIVIARQIENDADAFEIIDTEIAQDSDGNNVEIPVVLGVFRKSGLESQLADIQKKLTAIAEESPPSEVDILADAKADKIRQLQSTYVDDLENGIVVGDFTLAATESDQAKFTQLAVLLDGIENQLPEESKVAFEASEQTIVDLNNVPHTMTVAALRVVIIAYGQAVAVKWGTMAAKRGQVVAATTIEEVNLII